MAPSKYEAMWVFAMFDLPTDTREARKRYARFRKVLLQRGFQMLQYSVYARYCASEEAADTFRRQVRQNLPSNGEVRLVSITDRQFAKMEVYLGKKPGCAEKPLPQLLLF